MKTFDHTQEESQPSGEELLRAIARGDESAFAALYDRYSSTLLGFLIRILNDHAEAEDVLQELFMRIWQHAADFDETRGHAMAWLVMMTRSRAIDCLRAHQARERTIVRSSHEASRTIINDGHEDAIRSELSAMVRHALIEISENERQVLLLAYFDGLSQSEIAEKTATPVGTVKTRTRAGLKKLRAALNKITKRGVESSERVG